MAVGKVEAIKQFMGTERPVTFEELKAFMLADKPGYEWMAQECAKALGEELKSA